MSDASTFEVDVRIPPAFGLCAVSWEWDVPAGFHMIGPANADRPARLVVTVEQIAP